MTSLSLPRGRGAFLAVLVALAAGATVAFLLVRGGASPSEHASCPPGFLTRAEQKVLLRAEQRREGARERDRGEKLLACAPRSRPESFSEFLAAKTFQEARALAPRTSADPAAYGRAVRARQALIRANAAAADEGGVGVAGSAGTWQAVGH